MREKRKEKNAPMSGTYGSTRMAGTRFFFLLVFSNVFLGREYGDRTRLLSLAELAAPSEQSSVCFFFLFSLPHLLFHQPHCWLCLDPFFPPTAWGLMRWWNLPFPAFFFLWMMSGSCQARWLRVASVIWVVVCLVNYYCFC
ncbi:hypothetical protein B9Z19DRAFT_1077493 [Tuber borchii]|uniref:Uncharacterized protein n=1 Tax=Tuber borchii TaxID=42251 RepID=A0A2T7A0M1_TUBBO|nr:hypothetical protein B9Z19DRAFT_1077493 [Tuber borchii]